MTTQPDPTPTEEDLAQLLRRVTSGDLTYTEISRRSEIPIATISAWATRSRGTGRGPSRDRLRKLATAIGEPEHVVFAAASRKAPGPLRPDREAQLLELFREMTEEQQRMQLIQARAVVQDNRTGP